MAVVRCDVTSVALRSATSFTALLPTTLRGQISKTAVLYLLHGMTQDHTSWLRQTSIERYAEDFGVAVVMPQVGRSYYTDEVNGSRYWTFLSAELPAMVDSMFRVSSDRSRTFVAGLSMGGYGAVKWALREPGRFTAAASLSGALDIAGTTTTRHRSEDPRFRERLFGDRPVAGTDSDLMHLVAKSDPSVLPALRLWCGQQDGLLPVNRRFRDVCTGAGLDVDLVERPGGHDWDYWDGVLPEVLGWLLASPPVSR